MKTQTVPVTVNQFLEREEHKATLRKEADASWQHYQETGRHVTLEEANKWMDKIITGVGIN